MDDSPVSFQARCPKGLSLVKILKVGVPVVGFKPFAPHGAAPGFGFFPTMGHCAWCGVYDETVF